MRSFPVWQQFKQHRTGKPRPWPAAILISLISLSSAAAALTVFRLGGADQAPPQLEAPFDFVPLSWADFIDRRGSNTQDLNITGNFIAPLGIDPQTNLALSLRGGTGLTYLWFGDWREISNNDRAFFLYNMIDSDPTTVFWERRDMVVMLDFGRLLHLRRLRFTTPEEDGHFVPTYTVGHNDGDRIFQSTWAGGNTTSSSISSSSSKAAAAAKSIFNSPP